MRLAGWALFLLTLLYPWNAVRTWYLVRDLLASEGRVAPPGQGMVFDLRSQVIHCGIVGWLGGVAFLSLVWLLFALVGWASRRIRQEGSRDGPSRLAVAAVLAGVVPALGTQQIFEHVFGVLIL